MNWFKQSLSVEPESRAVKLGHLFLRVAAALMIFYIHGCHKLLGWLAYLREGKPWELEHEVAGMHMPAPLFAAVLATLIQFICPLFLAVGLFTRLNALLLAGALGGAIMQNLLAHRDPQLALLYTLVVVALFLLGGGQYSLDAGLSRRCQTSPDCH